MIPALKRSDNDLVYTSPQIFKQYVGQTICFQPITVPAAAQSFFDACYELKGWFYGTVYKSPFQKGKYGVYRIVKKGKQKFLNIPFPENCKFRISIPSPDNLLLMKMAEKARLVEDESIYIGDEKKKEK